jgi:PAS domain S-box-containing protein
MDNLVEGHLKQIMVDSLPDCGLVVLDTDGKVLSWNKGAQGLLGYSEDEAVGQPFSRIVPPETLDRNGAPSSLAIARKNGRHEEIVQRMRSDGTDFEVREIVIPLRDRKHTLVAFGLMMQSPWAPGNGWDKAGAGSAMASAKRRKKVLLVDDDDYVRATAANLLDDLGFEVLEAASGGEALGLLVRDEGIDLIFTDVMMPGGIGGGELAEQARQIRPDIKVLLTSGYFQEALVRKGSIAANANLLVKPYRRRDLARALGKILADDIQGSDDVLLAAE